MQSRHAADILYGMTARCLIVDDSAQFLRAARVLLEREGLVVDIASTGADALRLVEEWRPHVVLVDIDLGSESGFEVARQLDQRTYTTPSPPFETSIILVSTHDEEEFEELIAASPAVGFLAKSSLSARAIDKMLSGGDRQDPALDGSSGPQGT
jgi:CheY-like chemotaxis protein